MKVNCPPSLPSPSPSCLLPHIPAHWQQAPLSVQAGIQWLGRGSREGQLAPLPPLLPSSPQLCSISVGMPHLLSWAHVLFGNWVQLSAPAGLRPLPGAVFRRGTARGLPLSLLRDAPAPELCQLTAQVPWLLSMELVSCAVCRCGRTPAQGSCRGLGMLSSWTMRRWKRPF